MTHRWNEIWRGREVSGDSLELTDLLALNGYDSLTASLPVSGWTEWALGIADKMGLEKGERVYEVGCGAGAFLLPFVQGGYSVVGGIDLSASLIDVARRAIPDAEFEVGEALDFVPPSECEALVSMGVFIYFPDEIYARRVLQLMLSSARKAVAILDIPKLARRDATEAERLAKYGDEYAHRYWGLAHLYLSPDFFLEAGEKAGCTVEVWDQDLPAYGNAEQRFNVLFRQN